jgi:hypothetical protein
MTDIPSHHYIYGLTEDYLTGEQIVDTDDERCRQKIARILVEEKGYDKTDLIPRLKIETLFSKNFVVSTIDLVLLLGGKKFCVLRYGPGSLVTRERPAIAAARVLDKTCPIPFAAVTNGQDLEFIDVVNAQVIGTGFRAMPTKKEGLLKIKEVSFPAPLSGSQRERELRILNAYDVELCCAGGPCALPDAPEG